MKTAELLDAASAQLLGFDWLAEAVQPVSPYGDRMFSQLRPFHPGEEPQAQARAESIAALAAALDSERLAEVRAQLARIPDASGAIARASVGEVLDDPSFFEVSRFCATVQHIDALLDAETPRSPIANDALRAVGDAIAPGSRHDCGFYLDDAFGDGLAPAREALARAQAELDAARGRELAAAAAALGRESIEDEEFILMRAELRSAVPVGIRIVREAPTYLLCALEYGDAALTALTRRDVAATVVAETEEAVRARLSAIVRQYSLGLSAAANAVGELDVLFAAAHFTQRHACVAARIVTDPVLAFEQARFLPLESELAAAARRFVPLDLDLRDTAVLTGPNMGGKSVTLQTCGFVALCAAYGLPVPAARARIGLFDEIAWLGLGRDAQIGGLLSSFAREVLELMAILRRDAKRLLILADEFARTTTPHEGKALSVALLGRLRQRGACGLLATHLPGVAAAAGVRHFAVRGLRDVPSRPPTADAAEALHALAAAMDYRVAEVGADDPARADAIALVALLGLDREFVESAYRALSQ